MNKPKGKRRINSKICGGFNDTKLRDDIESKRHLPNDVMMLMILMIID
jgi:hypothetical protein